MQADPTFFLHMLKNWQATLDKLWAWSYWCVIAGPGLAETVSKLGSLKGKSDFRHGFYNHFNSG